MTSSEREVLEGTVRLLRQAHEIAPDYGANVRGSSTPVIAELLRKTGTVRRDCHFGVAKAMALPFRDGHLIARDPRRKHADQLFNDCHELAHVIAGEVGHFLTAEDRMSFSERRADLFSIVALTPTSWARIYLPGVKFLYAAQMLKDTYRGLTDGWSEQRLWDRAKLRVLLFREFEI